MPDATPTVANPHRRRWYQYSLRTLLVFVTILAVPCWYVGEQWRIVEARVRYVAEHPSDIVRFEESYHPKPEIPWIRKMLGDEPYQFVLLADRAGDDELDQAASLFLEAGVFRVGEPAYP